MLSQTWWRGSRQLQIQHTSHHWYMAGGRGRGTGRRGGRQGGRSEGVSPARVCVVCIGTWIRVCVRVFLRHFAHYHSSAARTAGPKRGCVSVNMNIVSSVSQHTKRRKVQAWCQIVMEDFCQTVIQTLGVYLFERSHKHSVIWAAVSHIAIPKHSQL